MQFQSVEPVAYEKKLADGKKKREDDKDALRRAREIEAELREELRGLRRVSKCRGLRRDPRGLRADPVGLRRRNLGHHCLCQENVQRGCGSPQAPR